ncbi:unnamed protein product [Pocillopora meandrina]|uniref:EGF-like domain-containing protein n=1 Tax=Pocillopora meandrina TaxID=46732 RepID=A0AAU9X4D6_9CNID|nr:unnamed protein product [Pocillopora meandrina]
MATRNNNCLTRKSLTVVNCGEFYLYNLFRIRSCGSNGWRYCTNGIADDKCSGDKCPNGKLCVLKDNGKQSECVDAPPSGTQSPIIPPSGDPCSSNPCSHGGTCSNNSNTYTCSCMFGYSGDNCDINSYEGKNFVGITYNRYISLENIQNVYKLITRCHFFLVGSFFRNMGLMTMSFPPFP